MTGDITLVFTTPRIHPATHLLDPSIYLVGPSFGARSEDGDDFPLALLDERRGVHLARHHLQRAGSFYRSVCKRLQRPTTASSWRSVTNWRPTLLPIPTNFILSTGCLQLEVLKRTDVFVTHGGMGSVHEALAQGVPMVVFPQMIEQSLVAGRVAALGAGVRLTQHGPELDLVSSAIVDAATLRSAVDRVLRTPEFARQARQLASEFRADTPAYAADIVQRYVRLRADLAA